jgi:5'-nucleotidase / UDP-sugar diphosphatase
MRNKIIAAVVAFFLIFINGGFIWAGTAVDLRILYVNDFHGYAEPHQPSGSPEKLGGWAYMAGEVNRLRKERPTLLLAAGDMIQGNIWTDLFQGQSTIEVMNALDFSAMVLGNHEFDFGQEVLKKRIQEARFPVLAANAQGLPGLVKSYILKDVSGLSVAIIGLVNEETASMTHPRNLKGLTFSPAVEAYEKVIQQLEKKPDLIIILSHLGLPSDRRLAKETKGIQVIVGGHTHTHLESPQKVKETLIVQGGEHAKVLGVLDLTIQDRKIIRYEGKLIPIQPDRQQPDPVISEIVARYQKQTMAILDEVIGEAMVDLMGKGSRFLETNLGNLVADILRQDTGADAALINGGSIRADIFKGPVRMIDLYNTLPFTNYPVVLKVTGRELNNILEYGLSDPSGSNGRFPQISGIKVAYNLSASEGQKIISCWIGKNELDPQRWYVLATNDFLAAGGDGYKMLSQLMGDTYRGTSQTNDRVLLFDSGREIRSMVINYIKTKKQISASLEGRIQRRD